MFGGNAASAGTNGLHPPIIVPPVVVARLVGIDVLTVI
jgi:hypothetical protein